MVERCLLLYKLTLTIMKYCTQLGICNNWCVAIEEYIYPGIEALIDNNALNAFFSHLNLDLQIMLYNNMNV